MRYRAIVVGASAGGLRALQTLIQSLPSPFPVPVIVAQHLPQTMTTDIARIFAVEGGPKVTEAFATQSLEADHVYLAPPGYHLLVENETSLTLSVDEPVQWARPSVDVLFESAAQVFGESLIGMILTGGNHDGANGLRSVVARGGLALVQDPNTAEIATMPAAALHAVPSAVTLQLEHIGSHLLTLLDG